MREHALILINRVVDTLDLRLSRNRAPSSWLLSEVDQWRAARDAWEPGSAPHLVAIPDVGTFILRGSARPFEFVLANREICDIRIWRPESWGSAVSSATGQVMFNFRSKFLQLVGLEAAREVVRLVELALIDPTGLPVYHSDRPRPDFLRVARGDLAVDLQTPAPLSFSDISHFVCQSRNLDTFTTLSDQSIKRLLESVQDGENGAAPPMDNKGVSIRTGELGCTAGQFTAPAPGPAELAASAALDAFTGAVKEELSQGKRGAAVTRSVLQGRTPKTVYFGRYTSQIFAKVYDKLLSLKPQKKLYMLDVWLHNGWDGMGGVWRWEFTFTGDFLKSMYVGNDRVDVREFDDFLNYIPALWYYCTRKWLRQVRGLPDQDKETHRMQVTPYWAVVQEAWDSEIGIERDNSRYLRIKSDRDRQERIQQLDAQILGCAKTKAALESDPHQLAADVRRFAPIRIDPQTGEVLDQSISIYSERLVLQLAQMVEDDIDLEADIYNKQRMIGMDDLSDSALTSLQRAERMAEGWGS